MIDKIFPKIHGEGYKFLVIIGLATIILYFIHGFLGFIGLVLSIWVYYFFRDPDRISINDDNYLTSPADGLVLQVLETHGPKELGLEKLLHHMFLPIFLSKPNVDIQAAHIHVLQK